jgi:hypothetical protein
MKMTINIKTALTAATIATATLASNVNATQKHDPIFVSQYAQVSAANDPDLIHAGRGQIGSPKSKKDWYALNGSVANADTRDLAREVRYQPGSPKSKQDPTFFLAPLR